MKKDNLFDVTNKVCTVESDLEKIKVLLRELELGHFNVNIEKGMNGIKDIDNPLVKLAWEHNNHRLLFEIMEDYVYSIYGRINGLRKELEGELKSC